MGNDTNALLQPTQEQDSGSLQEAANEACFAHFAVVIEYREQEQITELRLPQDIIAKLAFEAEFRGIRIGGLIGAIIAAIAPGLRTDGVATGLSWSRCGKPTL